MIGNQEKNVRKVAWLSLLPSVGFTLVATAMMLAEASRGESSSMWLGWLSAACATLGASGLWMALLFQKQKKKMKEGDLSETLRVRAMMSKEFAIPCAKVAAIQGLIACVAIAQGVKPFDWALISLGAGALLALATMVMVARAE